MVIFGIAVGANQKKDRAIYRMDYDHLVACENHLAGLEAARAFKLQILSDVAEGVMLLSSSGHFG
jgi:hypothetical protein